MDLNHHKFRSQCHHEFSLDMFCYMGMSLFQLELTSLETPSFFMSLAYKITIMMPRILLKPQE